MADFTYRIEQVTYIQDLVPTHGTEIVISNYKNFLTSVIQYFNKEDSSQIEFEDRYIFIGNADNFRVVKYIFVYPKIYSETPIKFESNSILIYNYSFFSLEMNFPYLPNHNFIQDFRSLLNLILGQ